MGPHPRGKEEPGERVRRGRKPRCRAGTGRRQEAGRGGGRGLRKNAPTSCPLEPGSRSRDAGPGIAEPDLGRPAGHLPARTPGTSSLAPPGLLPLGSRGRNGEEQGGDPAPRASEVGGSEPASLPSSGLFSHLSKRAKRKLGVVALACHPRTWEAEAGRLP